MAGSPDLPGPSQQTETSRNLSGIGGVQNAGPDREASAGSPIPREGVISGAPAARGLDRTRVQPLGVLLSSGRSSGPGLPQRLQHAEPRRNAPVQVLEHPVDPSVSDTRPRHEAAQPAGGQPTERTEAAEPVRSSRGPAAQAREVSDPAGADSKEREVDQPRSASRESGVIDEEPSPRQAVSKTQQERVPIEPDERASNAPEVQPRATATDQRGEETDTASPGAALAEEPDVPAAAGAMPPIPPRRETLDGEAGDDVPRTWEDAMGFMQAHDGNQPAISPGEQERTARELSAFTDEKVGVISRNVPERIQELGSTSVVLFKLHLQDETDIEIRIDHYQQAGSAIRVSHVVDGVTREDVTYWSNPDGTSVKRQNIFRTYPDDSPLIAAEPADLSPEGIREMVKEAEIAASKDRQLFKWEVAQDRNMYPIGRRESEGLQSLINRARLARPKNEIAAEHGSSGRDGPGEGGMPAIAVEEMIEEPEREPTLQAIQLAASLQTILTEFKKRGGKLEFFQKWGFEGIGEGLMNGERQGHIESFTGSGKSLFIALTAAAAVLAGQRVLIVGNRIENLDQLLGADGETGIGKFVGGLLQNKFVKQHYGGRKGDATAPIEMASYRGVLEEYRARKRGEKGRLGNFDVILGDECHWGLGEETVRALYEYMPDAIKMGFSATPDFAEDRQSSEIWGRKWFEFSLRAALESPGNVVSPIRPLLIPTDSTIELQDLRGEFTERELAPLINDPSRNSMALKFAQDFVGDGMQGVVGCIAGEGNLHARIMADLLSRLTVGNRTIVAKDYGSHLDMEERRRRLRDYKDGKIDILTQTYALEEAWDSNRVSFYIDLDPTGSPRRKKQRVGRLTRPKTDGRESIYVDFIDETSVVNDRLFTVLHALDLQDFDYTRVLGWGSKEKESRFMNSPQDLVSLLRPELLDRLMRMQGRSVTEVIIQQSHSQFGALFAQWDRILAKEGMPAELPYNIVLSPALEKRYGETAARLRDELGREPSHNEIVDSLHTIRDNANVARVFGERVDLQEVWSAQRAGELPGRTDMPQKSVEDIVTAPLFLTLLEKAMEDLSDQERRTLLLRFGLGAEYEAYALDRDNDNEDEDSERNNRNGLTLEEVGQIMDLSRERIRQIESQALSKLRSPSRSRAMLGLMEEGPLHEKPSTVYQKQTRGDSIFTDMVEVGIPVVDSRDPRPYLTRLKEASDVRTQMWLKEQTDGLDDFVRTRLELDGFLKILARRCQPVKFRDTHTRELFDTRPEGRTNIIIKVFERNELRAEGLYVQQRDVLQLIKRLKAARERVASRPLNPQSEDARAASLMVLDARIIAAAYLREDLQARIFDYLSMAYSKPSYIYWR